jgi:hypothetical protein
VDFDKFFVRPENSKRTNFPSEQIIIMYYNLEEWIFNTTPENMIGVCVILTRIYWILGMSVYSLKFWSKSFNEFTSYGKLTTYSRGLIHHKYGFTFFYIFAFFWNLFIIYLQYYLVCPFIQMKQILPFHHKISQAKKNKTQRITTQTVSRIWTFVN